MKDFLEVEGKVGNLFLPPRDERGGGRLIQRSQNVNVEWEAMIP